MGNCLRCGRRGDGYGRFGELCEECDLEQRGFYDRNQPQQEPPYEEQPYEIQTNEEQEEQPND